VKAQSPCPFARSSNGHAVEGHGTGFTLIEILIVMILIGLLLTLAVPHYQQFLQRGYRVEAITLLTEAAACQERVRANTGVYDPTRCTNFSSENPHYQITSGPAEDETVDGYILVAAPVTRLEGDKCGSLGLDHTGRRTITGPSENLWPCWSGR